MAVGFDAASESHTGTTGSASQASFTWNHGGGASARGALVFVFGVVTNALPPVTSVTYGGVTMTEVPYSAIDTDTEPGSVKAFYLDNCGTGTKAVVVNRTNNAHVMYAVCFTVTAASATEVYNAGVKTRAGSAAEQTAANSSSTGTATSAGLSSVDDGSPGTNSLRFMGRYQGSSAVTAAGSGSTAGPSIDFGVYVIDTFYETTAGQGARNVGGAAVSDDLAWIALAVRETPASGTQYTAWFVDGSSGHTRDANGGGLTFSGSAAKAPRRSLAAGLTFAGSKARQTRRALAGAVTSAGAMPKHVVKGGAYRSAVLSDSPVAYWRLGDRAFAPTWDCGFEDALLTTHWNRGGTPTSVLDSTVAGRTGTNAVRFDIANTAALDYAVSASGYGGNVPVTVGTFRFRFSALPTTDFAFFTLNGQTYYNSYFYIRASDGRLLFSNGGASDGVGPVVATGTWYTVQFIADGTSRRGRWMVDGIVQPEPSQATNQDNTNGLVIGKLAAYAVGAFSFWLEDIAFSHAAADYPISSGYVNSSDVWVSQFRDWSGRGHEADPVGSPARGVANATLVDSDGAVSFPSSSDYLTAPDHADFDFGPGGFSIEFWAARTADSGGWETIVNKGTGGYEVSIDPADKMSLTKGGVTQLAFSSATVPSDGSWHHYVWTVADSPASAGDYKLYVDGSPVTIAEYFTQQVVDTTGALWIGHSATDPPFLGKVDEVAIYPTILSSGRVSAHYAARAEGGYGSALSFSASLTRMRLVMQALSAGLTLAGSMVKGVSRLLPGSATFTGSAVRQARRPLSAGLAFVGSTANWTQRALAAGLTFAGSFAKQQGKAFSGSLSFAGSQARQTSKALAASLASAGSNTLTATLSLATTAAVTFAGSLNGSRLFSKALSGVLTFSGSASKQARRALAGVLTFTGGVATQFQQGVQNYTKDLFSGLGFTGSAVRSTSRSLAASITPSGALATTKVLVRSLTAGLTFVGAAAKQTRRSVTGSLASAGSLATRWAALALSAGLSFAGSTAKQARRSLASGLSFVGSVGTVKVLLRSLSAGLTFSGAQTQRAGKALAASFGPVGSITKRTARSVSSALPFSGSVVRRAGKALAGVASFAGVQTRRAGKALSASLTPQGALGRALALVRVLTASLSPSGVLNAIKTGMVQVDLTAALSFASDFARLPRKALSASLVTAGSVARRTSRSLAAGLAPAGSLQKRLGRPLAAVLSLSGGMARQARKSLSAALGLAGGWEWRANVIEVALSAVLGVSGSLSKGTRRVFAGLLALAGSLVDHRKVRFRGSTSDRVKGATVSRTRSATSARSAGTTGARSRGSSTGRDRDS